MLARFEISLGLLFFLAAVLKPRTVRVLPPDFCELPPAVYISLAATRSGAAIMSRMSRSTWLELGLGLGSGFGLGG